MVLDTPLFNIQHYKIWIKGKVEQSKENFVAIEEATLHISYITIEEDTLHISYIAIEVTTLHISHVAIELAKLHFSLVGRVFSNGPEDFGSISGHVIPKTLKMVLDVTYCSKYEYVKYSDVGKSRNTDDSRCSGTKRLFTS